MSGAALPPGFIAKISRAKEHLDALKASFDAYLVDGDSYSVIKQVDRQAGEYVFRIKLSKEAPLVEWALLIGDCFHNARTALDHLFWHLVTKQNPDGLPGNTSTAQFPIVGQWATFNGRKNLKDWLGEEAYTVVEQLQPYNNPKGKSFSSLMFLHDFDILDKHRLLLPSVTIVEGIKTTMNTPIATRYQATLALLQFEDNAEFARYKFEVPENVVDVDCRPTFDVVFEGQPGPMRVIPTLHRTIEVVEGVAENLRPFL